MAINLATKVSPKVDERFTKESVTENIGLNNDYDWDGVATVTVYDIPTVPLNDYTREGTSRYGELQELQDEKTDYTVTQDKGFTYSIDEGNSKSQMDIKMKEGASLGRETREVIIPHVDKYRLKVMHDAAVENGHTVDGASITKTNAYEKFLGMNELLDEDLVPTTGRVTYVVPSYYNKLKLDESFVKNSELGQKMVINGQMGEVDGNRIIKVPTSYLPEGCLALTVYPRCMVSPKKIQKYKRHVDPMGVDGIVVEGRLLFDAFILKSKKNAIAVLKSA